MPSIKRRETTACLLSPQARQSYTCTLNSRGAQDRHTHNFFLTFTADMVRQCLEMNNARLQMVQKEQRAPLPVFFFVQTVRMKG